jgi:hypothetical protein
MSYEDMDSSGSESGVGEMTPDHPDWPKKPDGTPLSPGAAAAVLRGRGQATPGGGGRARRSKSDGPDASYVEVKERIQTFYATYEHGSLVTRRIEEMLIGGREYIIVHALAYRGPEDPHPGTGTSWMEVPGKTPYTNGSELENAETSAWGRAIAAVGVLVDRGIASAGEIRSKGGDSIEQPSSIPSTNADALREAAQAALGTEEPQSITIPGDRPPAPVEPVAVVPVAESSTPVEAETPPAAEPSPPEPPEMPTEATETPVEPETAPTPDDKPEKASESTEKVEEGLNYDDFIRLAREKFVPNAHISATARDLTEKGILPQTGSVRKYSDQQRLTLLMAAMADSPGVSNE